jgi:hypothetical protein
VSEPKAPSPPTEDSKSDERTATTPLTVQVSAPIVEGPRVETPDLWLLAYERAGFDEKQKQILLRTSEPDRVDPWSPLDFVEEVKDVTHDQCAECVKSGWIANDGTRNVAVAQRAEKVITAVLEMKEFVSQEL